MTTQTYTTIRDLEQDCYCAGCGEEIDSATARWHDGQPFCDRAPSDPPDARAHTWYVVVMAGRWDSKLCRPIPRGPWGSEREARDALSGWMLRASQWASSEIARCSARLYQYPTREAARAADISDDVPGESLRGSSMLG